MGVERLAGHAAGRRLLGMAGKLAIDLLFAGTPVERRGEAAVKDLLVSRRFILAFWHSRILLVSHQFKGWGGVILVSRSNDGELIAQVLQRQGHEPVRGSTSRGGLRALTALVKRLGARVRPGVIVPDGPRGPRFVVQPGIIALARKTGYPILPVTYSARRITVFNSWDRFVLPHPFTRCCLVFGAPLRVAADADRVRQEVCRQRLQTEMRRITRMADRRFGHRIDA